ncbi:molecular chaperone DnaJ [Mycoplasma sp. 394]
MSTKRDYYEVLGVSKTASEQEIKSAYRSLAKKYHPDKSTDADSHTKMQEINEAYEVLSDSKKRSAYDQFGHAGANGQYANGANYSDFASSFEGFGDIFESIFSGFGGGSRKTSNQPRKGQDIHATMEITFMQSLMGENIKQKMYKNETCLHCGGSGAESASDIQTCSTCRGSGHVTKVARGIFGQMQQHVVCGTCGGVGKRIVKKCSVCRGNKYERQLKTVNLQIPQGIDDGRELRLDGYGEPGINGGSSGDMYIQIRIKPHKHFKRKDNDLYLNYPVSVFDVLAERDVIIPTPYGDVSYTLKRSYVSGQEIRIPGKGVKNKYGVGNLIVILSFIVPDISRKEAKLLNEVLAQISDTTNSDIYKQIQKTLK